MRCLQERLALAELAFVHVARDVEQFPDGRVGDAIADRRALAGRAHEILRPQCREVLRNGRLLGFEYLLQRPNAHLALAQRVENADAHAGAFTFDAIARAAPSVPAPLRVTIALLALVGFGSKAGLVPMHFWLPSAHPAAPATASALLSGVMLAVAVYGLALVGLTLAQPLPAWFGIALALVGGLGGAIGALYASLQSDIKRILAYSSIENTGIAIGALGLAFAAQAFGLTSIAALAMLALFFHVIAHGAFKSLLFLGAGSIVRAAGTSDLEHLGGLMRTLRFSAPFVLVGCAAAAALPVTCGFAAEWLIVRGFVHALTSGTPALAVAAAVTIAALALASGLAFATFAKFFGIGMLGQRRSDHVAQPERFDHVTVALAWLSAIVVLIGIAPELVMQQLGAAVQAVTGVQADLGTLPHVARIAALAPVLGLLATAWVARSRSIAHQPTWTCGSPVTRRSQYTATAFSQPIARIFAVAMPSAREPAIAFARSVAAFAQRTARRTRVVQGGRLRVYLAYAVLGALVVFWLAR